MADRGGVLVDLFVRDLDRIELPPRDRWQPAPRKESYVMKTSRYVLYAGAIAAVLVIALIASFQLRGSNQVAANPSPTASSTASAAPTASATPAVTTQPPGPTAASTGAITGRFAYGSDFIPPVTVYAISTTDPRVWYSVNFIGYGRGRSATPVPGMTEPGYYLISGVAPGTYWVVAYRTDAEGPDPGYYSRQVECQRTAPSGPCPDINPAMVTVAAGQTASGIDVITWGTQPQPSPTLPPRPTPR
jgi:hypothetical protein